MELKKGGLLERAMNHKTAEGICETCYNLVKVSETALGCAAHDKLIIPDYIPYHGNAKCPDWKKGERHETNA